MQPSGIGSGCHPASRRVACRAALFAASAVWAAAPCGTATTRSACHAADAVSDALLDEAAAAVDGNMALIERGVAKYRIVTTEFTPPPVSPQKPPGAPPVKPWDGKPRGPYTEEVTIYFDYPELRFDTRGQRWKMSGEVGEIDDSTIYGKEYHINYGRMTEAMAARHHRVRIDPVGVGVRGMLLLHPREQACPHWTLTTEALAEMRGDARRTVTAMREANGLLRVAVDWPTFRSSFWLSPAQGCCVVLAKAWSSGAEADEPFEVDQATYREAENGAFVLEHRLMHKSKMVDGVRERTRDEEATLLEVDMRSDLDPNIFTLDGLGLPEGAQIHDAVRGRKYEYRVPAVTESEIEPPAPGGAMAGRRWYTAGYLVVGLALAGLLAWKLRHARRRP